jgi:hypothetical protein
MVDHSQQLLDDGLVGKPDERGSSGGVLADRTDRTTPELRGSCLSCADRTLGLSTQVATPIAARGWIHM